MVATIISKKSNGCIATGKEIKIEDEGEVLQAICDSGSSASIVCKKCCTSISKYRCKRATWATAGGEFETQRKARIKFQLPEFSMSKEISCFFHVDKSNPNDDTLGYDMIIGRDLMTDLRIIIDFKDGYVICVGIKCPMKQHHSV
eukprot:13939063-Ditylum_brightwellii.AAC.1